MAEPKQVQTPTQKDQKPPHLTSRTIHYFWLVTRKHFGLFLLVILSTIGFTGFLSYGNPYVMSLIVDQISSNPVPDDQVFSVYGPFIIALILINLLCVRLCG